MATKKLSELKSSPDAIAAAIKAKLSQLPSETFATNDCFDEVADSTFCQNIGCMSQGQIGSIDLSATNEACERIITFIGIAMPAFRKGATTQGYLRKSGSGQRSRQLAAMPPDELADAVSGFCSDERNTITLPDFVSALKLLLKHPDAIAARSTALPAPLLKVLLEMYKEGPATDSCHVEVMLLILSTMDPDYLRVINAVLQLMHVGMQEAAHNLMNPTSLASCMAPSLLQPKADAPAQQDELQQIAVYNTILSHLVEHACGQQGFDVTTFVPSWTDAIQDLVQLDQEEAPAADPLKAKLAEAMQQAQQVLRSTEYDLITIRQLFNQAMAEGKITKTHDLQAKLIAARDGVRDKTVQFQRAMQGTLCIPELHHNPAYAAELTQLQALSKQVEDRSADCLTSINGAWACFFDTSAGTSGSMPLGSNRRPGRLQAMLTPKSSRKRLNRSTAVTRFQRLSVEQRLLLAPEEEGMTIPKMGCLTSEPGEGSRASTPVLQRRASEPLSQATPLNQPPRMPLHRTASAPDGISQASRTAWPRMAVVAEMEDEEQEEDDDNDAAAVEGDDCDDGDKRDGDGREGQHAPEAEVAASPLRTPLGSVNTAQRPQGKRERQRNVMTLIREASSCTGSPAPQRRPVSRSQSTLV